jgi:hypothetical protein
MTSPIVLLEARNIARRHPDGHQWLLDISAAVSGLLGLGLERRLLLAVVRPLVQLLAVGFVLRWLFTHGQPFVVAVMYQIVIMFLIAAGASSGTAGVVLFGYRRLFNRQHQFLPQRLFRRRVKRGWGPITGKCGYDLLRRSQIRVDSMHGRHYTSLYFRQDPIR